MRQLLLLLIVVAGCNAQGYTGVDGSGPQMVKEPLDTIFNEDSNIESLSLDCDADGDERPTYTWRRDDAPLDIDAVARYELSRGRLTITEPDRGLDGGTYQCFPSNQIGTIMSRKAKLEFAFLNVFPEMAPADVTVPLNSGICISCDLPDHHPGVNMYWYRSMQPVLPSSSTHTTTDGRLCFANYVEYNSGVYQCYARNSIDTGGGALAKYSLGFSVNSEPQTSDSAEHGPTVAIAVQDQEVLVNQKEVTLSCFFFGNPIPSILWRRKDGASLPVLYELKYNNQFLVLKNIQVDDAGEYECYTDGANELSSGNIVVRVPPTWVEEIADLNGNIYEDISWTCEAESPDGVTYKWYRNAEEIVDLPRHQITDGLKTLTILNLTVEDTGMYQCAAINDYGEIYTTAQLMVLAISPWFSTPLQVDQPAPRGGTTTILCQPEAAPTPTIQWTKGNLLITTDGHYTVLESGDLLINDVVDSDAGEYTCTATNSQGTGSSTGSLVVRDGTAIVEAPTDQTINEGEMGILTCRASHDPFFDLQYVWMKDGTQVDLQLANYEQAEARTGEASQLRIKDAILELGGEYTCVAVTSIDEVVATATVTIHGQPGAPAGISVVASGLTANISWSHGADNNSPILSYIIEGSTNHVATWAVLKIDVPASSTHSRLTGLSAWSMYKFRVVAVNGVGRGEPSEESDEVETAQDRPTQAPSNVGGGGGNEGDLRITWEPLPIQEWNAPDLSYIVFWKQQDAVTDFEQFEVTDSERGVYVVSGVPAYTPFDVKIQVKNSRGPGPMTDEFLVYSFQRRPEDPPTAVAAKASSATSIDVSWTGVDPGMIVGELVGYKLKYWPEGSTEELGTIVTSSGPATEATIMNLEPNVIYNFNVMAYSGGGDGPTNTETVTVMTLKSPPQQAPTGVKVAPKGTNSMTVKWNSITTSANEESLIGYKVLYWPEGDFEADATVEKVQKSTTQITIDGLKKGTTYFVKVKGYSSGGDGVASEPPQEVVAGKEETLPRSAASSVTTSVLLLLPLLVAFHLR